MRSVNDLLGHNLPPKKRLKFLNGLESISILADDPESSDDFNEYFGMSTRYTLMKETTAASKEKVEAAWNSM